LTISCDNYDYIEIACLYAYELKLQLVSDETLFGRAVTTGIDENKQEFMLIECHPENEKKPAKDLEVPLNQLKSLHVLSPNARFQEVIF
jgi:Rho-binding antiterminator